MKETTYYGILFKPTDTYIIVSKKGIMKGMKANMFALQNFSVPVKRTENRGTIVTKWRVTDK